MTIPRRWWRAAAIAALTLLVAPAVPGATGVRVLAHAQLVASSPGAGEVIDAAPDELRLVFSEPLEAQVTSLDVATDDGTAVLSRAGEIDPDDPYALVVDDPGLEDGIYSVTWRTLSAADGHTAEGFFSFGIGSVEAPISTAGEMTHSETDPVGVVGRWLTYIGLLLAVGVPVFHRVVVRGGPMPARLVRLLGAGLLLSAAATVTVAMDSALEAGSIADYLFGSRNGGLQTARAAVMAAGGLALLAVPPRIAGIVAVATGLLAIGLLVGAGHAAAVPGPAPLIGQIVHVVGAAVWIGGIVGLLTLIMRPRLLSDRPGVGLRTAVPRFSALALASIGLVGLTGVYAAWIQTGTILTVETEYGRTLLMKSGLAVAALSLGGLNYLDGGRMMSWLDGFRSRLTTETMTAGAVLVMTAALAATPPLEEAVGVPIEPIPDAFGEVAPGMGMEIIPGRPGVNRVVVTTTDAMAGSTSLELGLDRLDDGSTTLVPLRLGDMPGMDHSDGMAGMSATTDDGTVDWVADALVLPAGSPWDTSVRIMSPDGETEISRQRFAFTMADDAIRDGRMRSLLDPAIGVAALLLLGGGLGLGLGLGGASLPRCEAGASRLALLAGGGIGLALGGIIGIGRMVG